MGPVGLLTRVHWQPRIGLGPRAGAHGLARVHGRGQAATGWLGSKGEHFYGYKNREGGGRSNVDQKSRSKNEATCNPGRRANDDRYYKARDDKVRGHMTIVPIAHVSCSRS